MGANFVVCPIIGPPVIPHCPLPMFLANLSYAELVVISFD